MAKLLTNRDVRSLCLGACGAVTAGLLMGAAMQPQLRIGGEDPEGPQILQPLSGPRVAGDGWVPGATYVTYGEQVPDYVIGTDWLKPPPAADEGELYEEIPAYAETVAFADDVEPAYAPPPSWIDQPREPSRFPSMSGGVALTADLPAPPPPPPPAEASDAEVADLAAANPG